VNIDSLNIVLYYGLLILGEILIVLVLIHMLYNRRSRISMMAWLLSMILVPYISVFLYFMFGSRKRKNRYKKEYIKLKKRTQTYTKPNHINRVLRSYGVADASENEYVELYTDSTKAYEKFMSCIEDAKKSIYISTYIFNYDDVTKNIIDALVQKAKDGVEVKILIDSLGSLGLYLFPYRLKKLKQAGAKIRFFMPSFQMPFRNYINLRNHRKIFLFDNKRVLSGGMNISNEYFGPKDKKSRWEDMLFLIEGLSVELFFEIFASDWFYASDEKLDFTINMTGKRGEAFVQVVPSGPDMSQEVLYEALLSAIYSAKKRIWIVTPYFIPNSSLIQALIIAKHIGVDVKLITPKESDHLIVDLARSSYMRELEEAGAEVALYNGTMLHAKAILFDDTSTMLGSVNLDNRSLLLNYEVAIFVYATEVIESVELWMNKLLANSSIGMKPISKPRRIVENLMRILAPQL